MEIINISHNDTLAQVAQKCNLNFKQLAFDSSQQTKKQGRSSDNKAETLVTDAVEGLVEVTIPNEVTTQIQAQNIPRQIENAIDEKIPFTILSGEISQDNNIPANSYKDINVSFNHSYSSAPNVMATLLSTSTNIDTGLLNITIANITTNGFKARIFNTSNNQQQAGFNWLAIGV